LTEKRKESILTIEIVNLQNSMKVPKRKLRTLLKNVMFEELGREVNVSLAVVNDRRIAELNKTFRGHAGPTDVLAFPFGEKEIGPEGQKVFGEIVISAQRARHEARLRHIEPELELTLYAVHGMLHLVGYDHQSVRQAKKMRRRETEILKGFSPAKRGKKKR